MSDLTYRRMAFFVCASCGAIFLGVSGRETNISTVITCPFCYQNTATLLSFFDIHDDSKSVSSDETALQKAVGAIFNE